MSLHSAKPSCSSSGSIRRVATRATALLLAVALPSQGLLSCGFRPARFDAPYSRLAGSKTELDFDRDNNGAGTSVQEGGGWSNDGSQNGEAPASADNLPPGTPFMSRLPSGGYLVFDGESYEVVDGSALGVSGGQATNPPAGVPVDPGTKQGEGGLQAVPSGPGQGAPDLVWKGGPGGDGADGGGQAPGGGYAPKFPLNPSKLTKRDEVLSDIAKRLDEREAKADRRRKEFDGQADAAGKKGSRQAPGDLRKETEGARAQHSQAAGGVGDAVDGLIAQGASPGQGTSGSVGKPLPGDGLPGGMGERLQEKKNDAQRHASEGRNPYSGEFARHAKDAYDRSAKKGRTGNFPGAQDDEQEGDLLRRLAGTNPDQLPSPPPEGPIPPDGRGNRITQGPGNTRGEALRTGLGLYDAAGALDGAGLGAVADKARAAARTLFEVSLGMTRMTGLLDVPLSVMELAGVTPTLDDNGNVALREATKIEMAFAVAALGAAGVTFAAGGWTAVVGAGVVGGLTKAMTKGLGRRLALREAEIAAEEAAKLAPKVVEKLDDEGLKALERALQGHPRINTPERVRNVVDTFENGQLERFVVPPDTEVIVYRWHDAPGGKARPKGAYVTPENLTDAAEAREKLAILPDWSSMEKRSVFRVKPGTEYFAGKTAPQGPYKGGATQYFLAYPDDALEEIVR